METVLPITSDICLGLGAFFILTGSIGVYRMPDFYTRLHPASIGDSLGLPLIVVGAMLHIEPGLATIKLLLLVVFSMITSATASHALAKAALLSKIKPIGEIKAQKTTVKKKPTPQQKKRKGKT